MKRCLMITGGETGVDFLIKVMQENRFDAVFAIDSGANACMQAGVVPDLLIGDLDSVSQKAKAYCEGRGVEIMKFPPEKDLGDSEIGILKVIELGFDALVILGGTGKRLDHLMTNMLMLSRYSHQIDCTMMDPYNTLKVYHGPQQLMVERDDRYPFLSLVPFSDTVSSVTLEGMKYPLNGATLERGSSLSISNEVESERGCVKFEAGVLALIRARDA